MYYNIPPWKRVKRTKERAQRYMITQPKMKNFFSNCRIERSVRVGLLLNTLNTVQSLYMVWK